MSLQLKTRPKPYFAVALCFLSLGCFEASAQTDILRSLFGGFAERPMVFVPAAPNRYHLPYALNPEVRLGPEVSTTYIYGNILEGKVNGSPLAVRYEGYGITYQLPFNLEGPYSGGFSLDAERYNFDTRYDDVHGPGQYTFRTQRHRVAIQHNATIRGFFEAGVNAGVRTFKGKERFEYGARIGIAVLQSRLGIEHRAVSLDQLSTVLYNEDEILLPLALKNQSTVYYLETDFLEDVSVKSYLRRDHADPSGPGSGIFSGTPQSRQTGFGIVVLYERSSYSISTQFVSGSPYGLSRFQKNRQQYAKINIPEFRYRLVNLDGTITPRSGTDLNAGFSRQSFRTHIGVIAEGWPFVSLVDLLGTRYNADVDGTASISLIYAGMTQLIGKRHTVSGKLMHVDLDVNAGYSHRKSEGLFGFSDFYQTDIKATLPVLYLGLGYSFSAGHFSATLEAGQLTRSFFRSYQSSNIFNDFQATGGGTFARVELQFHFSDKLNDPKSNQGEKR